jgi:hypothetical protein
MPTMTYAERQTRIRELHVAFDVAHVYDFITTLYWQHAEAI